MNWPLVCPSLDYAGLLEVQFDFKVISVDDFYHSLTIAFDCFLPVPMPQNPFQEATRYLYILIQ